MATIKSAIKHENGIPLGGLGTGTVEIQPDGYFHEWQIYNLGKWAPRQPECCKTDGPDMPPTALSFYVRTKQGESAPLMRRLGMRTDAHDMYSYTWLKSVQGIEFTGRFPMARLGYIDEDLPVSVESVMFSPFVPHDAKASGVPGFHCVFTVKNRTRSPVSVSLLGALKNPVACGAQARKLTNSVASDGETTFVTTRTAAEGGCKATLGSMCFSVTGGQPGWIAGEYSEFLKGFCHWDESYGLPREGMLEGFRATGRLPSLKGDRAPSDLLNMPLAAIQQIPSAKQTEILAGILQYPFAASLWNFATEVSGKPPATHEEKALFLKNVAGRLNRFAGNDRSRQTWGDMALCSSVDLKPGEEKEVRFTVAWHFPYHFSLNGPVLGHMYENWFADAEAVCRRLAEGYRSAREVTVNFADTLYDTTLDESLADAWSGQLSTITKCTWWLKDGKFAVWEGLGCCGFHTTDITYQGSFNILALFPELQKLQMEMGATFQRADGRVHHFFTPDLYAVDQGFDRVDMNQQFVLLVCRDYLWTGDKEYIRRLWPSIMKAMDNTAQLDGDGDGLPDHDTKRNTYDAWNFFGTPSYIASLWLSALLAAIRLAEELGETDRAAEWRALLKKGTAAFETRLWNGEYYSLWNAGDRRDECCMTDQVDGEWFTSLIGLGTCLPRERILAALRAVVKYNFSEEDGLINASYPPGANRQFWAYRNLQAAAPWTGIEYAIASMMMDFGMVKEGSAVVRNIHERYLRAGRFWNHVECGDHYYRAMSSWAVLLGATGFRIDVPMRTVTFAPPFRTPVLRAPWVSSTGWGTFEKEKESFELICRGGELRFRVLNLNVSGKALKAKLNGKALAVKVGRKDKLAAIEFASEVAMKAGDTLVV